MSLFGKLFQGGGSIKFFGFVWFVTRLVSKKKKKRFLSDFIHHYTFGVTKDTQGPVDKKTLAKKCHVVLNIFMSLIIGRSGNFASHPLNT